MKTNNKKTTKQTTNKKTNKTKVVNKKIDNVLPISNKENRLTNKEKENEVKSLKRTRAGIIKSKKFEYKAMVKAKALRPDRKAIRDEYKRIHVNGESTMSDPSNIIEIRNLRKIFFTKGNFEKVLNGVDLDVKRGEIAVILGASGGGKTTLLNIVSGLIQPTSGSVKVVDKNLFWLTETKRTTFRKDNVSFVFQSYNLIPSLTVAENVRVGQNLKNADTETIEISSILESLGLSNQSKKYPYQLSGGQQQRVSIGRALAKNPKILFADEPTGALDEERGKETLRMIIDINKKYQTTIIMVTHNPNIAKIGDSVIEMKNGVIHSHTKNKKRLSPEKIKWS